MNHTMDAIAWALIHFCWQAAAVAVLYRVLMVAFARSSSSTRYALSVAAMLLMAFGACATFTWEISSAHPSPRLAPYRRRDPERSTCGGFSPKSVDRQCRFGRGKSHSTDQPAALDRWRMGAGRAAAFAAEHRWMVGDSAAAQDGH